jgi:hypothetical protein
MRVGGLHSCWPSWRQADFAGWPYLMIRIKDRFAGEVECTNHSLNPEVQFVRVL